MSDDDWTKPTTPRWYQWSVLLGSAGIIALACGITALLELKGSGW